MRIPTKVKSAKNQGGVVLIEALIAVLLFSLGVLALVGMQAVMAKNVTHSKVRSEASFLTNQLIGQMWVDQANLGSYAMASNVCTTSSYTKCTNWLSSVGRTLPSGSAAVTITGTSVDITVTWRLPDEAPSQFQIVAVITS